MRKLLIMLLLALAACQAPNPAYQQAIANLPAYERTYCETQAMQMAGAYNNPRSLLGLESVAAGNKARGMCLQTMIERHQDAGAYGGQPTYGSGYIDPPDAPAVDKRAQGEAMLAPLFARYGRGAVMQCGYGADAQGGDETAKMQRFLDCTHRLSPL